MILFFREQRKSTSDPTNVSYTNDCERESENRQDIFSLKEIFMLSACCDGSHALSLNKRENERFSELCNENIQHNIGLNNILNEF